MPGVVAPLPLVEHHPCRIVDAVVAPLLDLPLERVLCSHGNPVLRNGGKALHDALAAG